MKNLWIILSLTSLLYSQIWSPPIKVDPPGLSLLWGVIPVVDKFERIWCAKRFSHWMFYLDTLTQRWSKPESIPGNVWFFVGRMKDGDLWIYTRQGFFFYNYDRWSELILSPLEYVRYAVGDSANRLWMVWEGHNREGASGIVVSYYNGWRWVSPYLVGGGLPGLMTVDRDGRIWVSWFSIPPGREAWSIFTRYYGENKWSDPLLVKEGLDQFNFLWDWFAPDTSGGVWLATVNTSSDSASVLTFYYDGNGWKFIDSIYAGRFPYIWEGNHPHPQICVDYSGIVWLVWESTVRDTGGEAYFSYYDGKRWSEPAPIHPSFHLNEPKSLVVDNKNRVWVFLVSGSEVYTSHTQGRGIEKSKEPKMASGLLKISPNPFKEVVSIKYQVTSRGPVALQIYDVSGRLVKTLVKTQKPRAYELKWNGRDDKGKEVPSGIYLLRFEAGGVSQIEKLILMR